ncbi:ATPase with role in protein import into the ER, partial [Ascosphaera pollenicola]
FTTNYWPGDGLFHLDAAVYDMNCDQMDKAKYIYKATTLKGSLPYTLHMHNFTKNENSIEVMVKYNGTLITHPGTNCTHKPDDHLTICPMQFKC